MTHEDVIRMARQASDEYAKENAWRKNFWRFSQEELHRFAALVAAERDARACRIVYGLCASDNEAQRIVDAINETKRKTSK
jgi:hypothetical protein